MKIKKFLIMLMLVIFIGVAFYSLYNIVVWKLNIDKNKVVKATIEQHVKIVKEEEKAVFQIDFNKLKGENSDTIAYVKVNNTNINYVVVRGSDNHYYLKHNFYKEYNIAGWVYADFRNKFDGSDKNIVLYGHDTKDGSMFGTLKNVFKKDWYENPNNLNIILVTESGESVYQIFSTYIIDPEEYYLSTSFINDSEYLKFIDTIKKRSTRDFSVNILENDAILTLSTCIYNGNKRVVVHAKKIDNGV